MGPAFQEEVYDMEKSLVLGSLLRLDLGSGSRQEVGTFI